MIVFPIVTVRSPYAFDERVAASRYQLVNDFAILPLSFINITIFLPVSRGTYKSLLFSASIFCQTFYRLL